MIPSFVFVYFLILRDLGPKRNYRPDVVVHACNPSVQNVEARGSGFIVSLGYRDFTCVAIPSPASFSWSS